MRKFVRTPLVIGYFKRSAWLAISQLCWLMLALPAQAVSFDCAKAQSKAEKLICGPHPYSAHLDFLSILDDDLNMAYLWAQMRTENPQKLVKAQRHWLRTVRDACQDEFCLTRALNARIAELTAQASGKGCYALAPIMEDKDKIRPIEPICHVMEKNLNRFCDQPPMACGLKIAPEFHDQLTLPEWTPLDPEANRALIEAFIRAPWVDEPSVTQKRKDELWEEERPKIEKAFDEKSITFSQARLDLYNLGQAQLAYRLDYNNCQALNPSFRNRKNWGKQRTVSAPVQIQHAPEIVRELFKQYFPLEHSPLSDVFLYDGKVYDYWMLGTGATWKYPPEFVELYVNRHERWNVPGSHEVDLQMDNICRFKYQPKQGESK